MGFVVTHKGKGKLEDLVARIKSSDLDRALTVGVHRDVAQNRDEPSGPTNADLALWHEYGTQHVPARPFLRPVFAGNRSIYAKILADQVKKFYMKGTKTAVDCLHFLGRIIVSDVRKGLLRGVTPALSEERIKQKRKAGYPRPHTPLFATGALFNSIEERVEGEKK